MFGFGKKSTSKTPTRADLEKVATLLASVGLYGEARMGEKPELDYFEWASRSVFPQFDWEFTNADKAWLIQEARDLYHKIPCTMFVDYLPIVMELDDDGKRAVKNFLEREVLRVLKKANDARSNPHG